MSSTASSLGKVHAQSIDQSSRGLVGRVPSCCAIGKVLRRFGIPTAHKIQEVSKAFQLDTLNYNKIDVKHQPKDEKYLCSSKPRDVFVMDLAWKVIGSSCSESQTKE